MSREKYDCVIATLSDIATDGRARAFAESCVALGKRTLVICRDNSDLLGLPYEAVPILPRAAGRVAAQWKDYVIAVRRILKSIDADNYIAAELYSLLALTLSRRAADSILVYDSREIFSALATLGGSKKKQFVISAIERFCIRKADVVVASGELDAEYLRNRFNLKEVPVIMNLPPFRERMDSEILHKAFPIPKSQRILLYQGAVHEGRGLVPAVKSLKYAEEFTLCILGRGPFEDELALLAEDEGVGERVVFCGEVPYEKLHEHTCSADVGLCFIEPISFSYSLSLPNKLFEYIMAGLPVLASDLPAHRAILEETNVGLLLPAEALPEQIAIALRALLEKRKYHSAGCALAALKYNRGSLPEVFSKFLK
ncbi:MAG: glycosyltransferase [Chloroflexota bacterium]